MNYYNIVIWRHSSALIHPLERIVYTEMCVSYNLGNLKRNFGAGVLEEYMDKNLY